jgi:hypothetical protein
MAKTTEELDVVIRLRDPLYFPTQQDAAKIMQHVYGNLTVADYVKSSREALATQRDDALAALSEARELLAYAWHLNLDKLTDEDAARIEELTRNVDLTAKRAAYFDRTAPAQPVSAAKQECHPSCVSLGGCLVCQAKQEPASKACDCLLFWSSHHPECPTQVSKACETCRGSRGDCCRGEEHGGRCPPAGKACPHCPDCKGAGRAKESTPDSSVGLEHRDSTSGVAGSSPALGTTSTESEQAGSVNLPPSPSDTGEAGSSPSSYEIGPDFKATRPAPRMLSGLKPLLPDDWNKPDGCEPQ